MSHWTRDQVLIALNLYCQMDFGKFHQNNPRIIAVAKQIGRDVPPLLSIMRL